MNGVWQGEAKINAEIPLLISQRLIKHCSVLPSPTLTDADLQTKDQLRTIYRAMLGGRLMEAKLSSLYKAGKIVGGVYLGTGQEAVSASLGCSLTMGRDVYSPLIRDQAGRTGFGEPFLDCARTYLGSAAGPMRGRDGNIHRGNPAEGYLAMISHLGTSVSAVAGVLLARRIKGELEGCVGATCIGDGGTSTGAFHEGLNLAAVEKLPLVVIIADNQFAYSTPSDRQFACRDLSARAEGYGVKGHEVDGTSLEDCARVIGGAVEAAREGGGPQLVVAKLLRLSGHGEHDDGSYVPQELRQSLLARDCVELGAEQLIAAGHATREEITQWSSELRDAVQEAVAIATQEAAPDARTEDWFALSTPSMREGDYES